MIIILVIIVTKVTKHCTENTSEFYNIYYIKHVHPVECALLLHYVHKKIEL